MVVSIQPMPNSTESSAVRWVDVGWGVWVDVSLFWLSVGVFVGVGLGVVVLFVWVVVLFSGVVVGVGFWGLLVDV